MLNRKAEPGEWEKVARDSAEPSALHLPGASEQLPYSNIWYTVLMGPASQLSISPPMTEVLTNCGTNGA